MNIHTEFPSQITRSLREPKGDKKAMTQHYRRSPTCKPSRPSLKHLRPRQLTHQRNLNHVNQEPDLRQPIPQSRQHDERNHGYKTTQHNRGNKRRNSYIHKQKALRKRPKRPCIHPMSSKRHHGRTWPRAQYKARMLTCRILYSAFRASHNNLNTHNFNGLSTLRMCPPNHA